MDTPSLENIIESIIFVSDQPVTADAILDTLNGKKTSENGEPLSPGDSEESEAAAGDAYTLELLEPELENLLLKYQEERYPFEIRKVAKGFQFFTKKEYYPFVRQATVLRHQKRLTRAAMETLAIVAYRQPVTKSELEFIRGVNCDYAIQKLLEKKLVAITGRADTVGKPLLYSTSEYFMQYFGINGAEDLPKLKEFEELMEDNLQLFRQHHEGGEEVEDGMTEEKAQEDIQESENEQEDA